MSSLYNTITSIAVVSLRFVLPLIALAVLNTLIYLQVKFKQNIYLFNWWLIEIFIENQWK
jgi:hypothetical protein